MCGQCHVLPLATALQKYCEILAVRQAMFELLYVGYNDISKDGLKPFSSTIFINSQLSN